MFGVLKDNNIIIYNIIIITSMDDGRRVEFSSSELGNSSRYLAIDYKMFIITTTIHDVIKYTSWCIK